MKKNINDTKTAEENTSSKNDKNNSAAPSPFDTENNNLHHNSVIEGLAGAGKIYFKAADKAIFEIIRGWYPDISFKEMLVCWQAYWTKSDHNFPAYEEVIAQLKESKMDEIPEPLRKEYHVNNGDGSDVSGGRSSQSLLLFSSEWDIKRAISQAHRKGYIKYEIIEQGYYGPREEGDEREKGGKKEKPDPATLIWCPSIMILLKDQLYEELDEATKQFCTSSLKQFFPSSGEDQYGD